MRRLLVPLLLTGALGLSGCAVVSAVGTVADVAGTAVSATAHVAGAAVDAVTPDSSSCANDKSC